MHLININIFSISSLEKPVKGTCAECLQELFFHDGNKLTVPSAHKFRMMTFAVLRLYESIHLLGVYSGPVIFSPFQKHVPRTVFNLGNTLNIFINRYMD